MPSRPRLSAREPVDPDVDERPARPPRRSSSRPGHLRDEATLVGTIAVGGSLGALARFLAGRAWGTGGAAFPWTTLTINVLGCALIGVLMVLVTDVWTGRRLLRPFVGTGVLGGFTTFSTYAVDIQRLATGGRALIALAYLVVTAVAALAAVWVAAVGTRALVERRAR
ncbi:MAG: fluoride efflux transporter FluC [Oryzihumus sp.]